jgi:DnaD/phage-associated family protein
LLQRSYKQIEEQFGLTMKQAKETLVRLEQKNVIKRVFRTVNTPQGRLPNIMFIELIVDGLIDITYPKGTDVCTKKDGYQYKKGRMSIQERTDITEITTDKEEEAPQQEVNPFQFYEENGFGTIGGHIAEKIGLWCDDLSPVLVLEAMKIAVERGAKSWSYVERILRDWDDKKYTTIEQVHAAIMAFKEKCASPKYGSHKKKTRMEDFDLDD